MIGRRVVALALAVASAAAAQSATPGVGHPFTLRASDGGIVTDRSFAGDVRVVLFGYTNCPDVCPTTLAAASAGVRDLGTAAARRVHILFISVDPARDSPAALASYAHAFGPRVIALTGSRAQLDQAARAFHTTYSVEADRAGRALVAHSGLVYLFDGDGRLMKLLPPGTPPARYAEELRRIMTPPAPLRSTGR